MKLNKEDRALIQKAKEVIVKSSPVNLIDTGDVGSIMRSSRGNLYEGVCTGFYCGMGSCGEYQAMGSMITNGEKQINAVVAVAYSRSKDRYRVIPPCGKCREMMLQACKKNSDAWVIVSNSKKVKLKDLMPYAWGGSIEK